MLLLTSSSRRLALLAALVPAARTVPRAVAAVAALAVLPSLVVAVTGGDDFAGALHAASVIAGAGIGYALDDAAAVTLAPSPTTLALRRSLRVVSVVSLLVAAWLAAGLVAALAGSGGMADVGVLTGALIAEAAAAAALSFALAGGGVRGSRPAPGFAAATAATLTMVLLGSLSQRLTFLPTLGGGPHHARWWWVTAAALAVTVVGWRDPAARRPSYRPG